MTRNLVVNGVTYNGVESLEIPDDAGDAIPYVELPELTNPGVAADLLRGKQLIDDNGKIMDGTMINWGGGVNAYLSRNTTSYTIPEGHHDGTGKVNVNVETLEVTPSKIERTYLAPVGSTTNPSASKLYGAVKVGAIPDQYQDVTPVTATDDHVFAGDVFVDAQGNPVPGTFTLEEEVKAQNALIPRIKAALQGKISGLPAQEKTVEITENGTHEIVPDAGYTLSKAVVNVNVEGAESIDGIPAGYARCDYIYFNIAQIVDTGVICNQDTKIRIAFARERSTQHYLFGVASSGNTASVTAYLGGSWRFGNKSATKTPTTNADMIYSGMVDKAQISVTGSASTISSVNNFETVGSLLLGACRSSDGSVSTAQFQGKVFHLAMWQGEEQALKLVPVVSAEGVYRFWDFVSKTFFDSITDTALEGGNL